MISSKAFDGVGNNHAGQGVVCFFDAAPMPPLGEVDAIGPIEEFQNLDGWGYWDIMLQPVIHLVEYGGGENLTVLSVNIIKYYFSLYWFF